MKISHSLTIETADTGSVTLRFVDENGTQQTIQIPGEAADLILTGMLSIPPTHHPTGKTSHPRKPIVVRSASGNRYNNGLVGLSLKVDDRLSLNIAFSPEAIPAIKNQLDRLLTSEPPAVH